MIASPRVLRRIAAALMLSSSLTFASVALSGRAEAAGAVETFLTSKYTYCDAKLISGLWSISIDEAKASIGQKILNGIESNIPSILAQARQNRSCDWADTPHSYEDAEQLAKFWGYANVGEAKEKVAYLYTQGESAAVVEALGQLTGSADAPMRQAQLAAFFDSDYTYCDAKLVGALWSIDIEQAKAEIGQKILGGYPENIPGILAQARTQAFCDFADTGLAYDDAVMLARLWGVSTMAAKVKAAKHYTNGESAIVTAALGQTGDAPMPAPEPRPVAPTPIPQEEPPVPSETSK